MGPYRPGDTLTALFSVQDPNTGAAVNADSTPTASVYKNGTVDGAVTVTVTNVTTGLYKTSTPIPGTYTAADEVEVVATITVSAAAAPMTIAREKLVQWPATVLPNAVAGANTGLPVVGTQVPNATAGAAGGLFIAGSNAATTVSGLTTGALSCTTITASGAVAFQSTFAVTTSTSLGALSCTTLTASGAVAFQSTFGVTGATSLAAVNTSGTVTFNAMTVTNNLLVSGNSTVTGTTTHTGAVSLAAGLAVTQSTTNGHGITVTGNGTGNGMLLTSGAGATGDGVQCVASSTLGHGLAAYGTASGIRAESDGTGHGLIAVGGTVSGDGIRALAVTSGHGINASGAGTSKHGFLGTGATAGTSDGMKLVAGTGGVGFRVDTFTSDGATTFNSFTIVNALTVSGATTLTGAVTASSASNNIVGVDVAKVNGTAQSAGDLFAAINNIAVTGAALNATAASATYTTGTSTGGVTNTVVVDGVYDSVADTAGTVDFYYQFSLGSTNQTGVGVNWIGYVAGVVNVVKVYAYNWGNSAWDQVGSVVGISGTNVMSVDWELTTAHTGTGGNVGLVRVRFAATGLVSSTTKTDRILCGYAVTPTYQSGDAFARLGAPAGASIAADIAEVEAETDDIAAIKAKTDSLTFTVAGYVDANTLKVGGTTQTARDLGASVLLSAGSGTGQLDFTSGVVKANVTQSNGTTNAATAGYFAPDWGHVNAPTTTVSLSGTTVGTITTYTGNTPQTGDNYARLGAPAGASIAADLAEIEAETDGIAAIPTSNPSAAAIATAVWQDATAGDFTIASSIGKSLYTSGVVPGANGGLLIAGSNAAITFATLTSTGAFSVNGVSSVAQTGDVYAQTNSGTFGLAAIKGYVDDIGVAGAGLTAIPDSAGTTTLLSRLSASRAGYLDNLNVGGAVASQADVQAVNQSASKHLIIQTVGQYERPDSGSVTYTVEVRTFSASTGAAVNADSTPTVAPVGSISGDLSANLGAGSNPATGVYRYVYTVTSGATVEQIRFDASATIAAATFTLSCYSQVTDLASTNWTATDASHLTSIFNKLPTNNIADETLVLAAVAGVQSDTDDIQTRLPAALVGGRMDASAGALAANVVTSAAIASGALNGKGDWSTLTQSQVTGGAYSVQSASCVLGDARIANLDAAVSTRGTSTLTQTQVTGGAYSIQSASCVLGDARVAHLDADISGRMASYTQPAGFLAATFPATLASPTNITGGIITTVTNLTNAPTAGDFTAVMKTSLNAATPVATLASGERTSIASALLDYTDGIETGLTPRGAIRLIAAANSGKLSGAATATVTIRNVGDTKNRIVATVDSDGNRSAVTTDAS